MKYNKSDATKSLVVKEEDIRHLGGADFIVVIEDRHFVQRAKLQLSGKDWGKTRSEQLHRKLARKLSSVKLCRLSDANAPLMRKVLYPTAKVNMIYRKHPYDNKRYWHVSMFHDLLIDEQRHELYNVMRSVGGKHIKWKDHPIWNRSYTSPDAIQPNSSANGRANNNFNNNNLSFY